MDLSVIVPCYNEAENVPKLRREFFPVVAELAKTRSTEVIVVDDGSTDETYQALAGAFAGENEWHVPVRVEQHTVNRGLGAALRTGFAAARGDIMVTTDSDGTYQFSEIPTLLSHLTCDVDMVTASPYHPAGGVEGVPPYRLVLSQGSSIIYRVLVSWKVHTYTSLFRAYRRKVVERVPFESNGFLAGTELLVNGMLMGYRVAEYPAILYSRVHGTSKAKLARTILAHLRFQAQVFLRRLNLAPRVGPRRALGGQA